MTTPLTTFRVYMLQRLADVLAGRNIPRLLTAEERDVLSLLLHHSGKHKCISRGQLVEQSELPDRELRNIISTLREQFALPIGVNREAGGGYYLAETLDEVSELTGPMIRQALSLLRCVRSLNGRHATAELLGQVRIHLQLDQEDTQHE